MIHDEIGSLLATIKMSINTLKNKFNFFAIHLATKIFNGHLDRFNTPRTIGVGVGATDVGNKANLDNIAGDFCVRNRDST